MLHQHFDGVKETWHQIRLFWMFLPMLRFRSRLLAFRSCRPSEISSTSISSILESHFSISWNLAYCFLHWLQCVPLPLEVDLYNQSNYGVISIYHITINTLTSVKHSTVTYDKPGFETNILVFLGPTFQVSPQCSTPPSSSLDHRPGPTPTTTPAKLHPGNASSIGRTTETCENQWNTIEQQQRKNKKWKLVLETQCLFFGARIQAKKKCEWGGGVHNIRPNYEQL